MGCGMLESRAEAREQMKKQKHLFGTTGVVPCYKTPWQRQRRFRYWFWLWAGAWFWLCAGFWLCAWLARCIACSV